MERELWKILSHEITLVDHHFPRCHYTHSVGRIVRVYLWAVLNDRPVYWACKRSNWRGVHPPRSLPDQSRMSRRLRRDDTQRFIAMLIDRLTDNSGPQLMKIVDGMPLVVSRHSQDADATVGRAAGGFGKGYKLHAIYGKSLHPLVWCVHPLNIDERKAAGVLVGQLSDEGYLLGDKNYDSNRFFDRAGECGQQLVVPRRYGRGRKLGHIRHSPYRLRSMALLESPGKFGWQLYKNRRKIETRFGNLKSFGGGLTHLPPWVRRLHRVRMFVDAKLLIRAVRFTVIERNAA